MKPEEIRVGMRVVATGMVIHVDADIAHGGMCSVLFDGEEGLASPMMPEGLRAIDAVSVPRFRIGDMVQRPGHSPARVIGLRTFYVLAYSNGEAEEVAEERLSRPTSAPPVRRPVEGEWWTIFATGRICKLSGGVAMAFVDGQWQQSGIVQPGNPAFALGDNWKPLPRNHVPIKGKGGKIEIRELGQQIWLLEDARVIYALAKGDPGHIPMAELADGFNLDLHCRLWDQWEPMK